MKSSRKVKYILSDTWPRPYFTRQIENCIYGQSCMDLRNIVRNNIDRKVKPSLIISVPLLRKLLEIYPGT